MADAPLMRINDLSRAFGGLMAVSELSFEVAAGSITSIIGPNGAGKSTLFNLISGIDHPTSGTINFDEQPINTLSAHRRAELGMARTFQTPHIFENMTVLDNVMVGRHLHGRAGLFDALFSTPRSHREDRDIRAFGLEILVRVGLADKAGHLAADLAFGQLKLLELARALAMKPRVMLLDECAAGLTRAETEHMMDIIRGLRAEGMTVVLVEHDMHLVMNLSDKVVVLNFGRKIGEGTPDEVQRNAEVIEVYLGVDF